MTTKIQYLKIKQYYANNYDLKEIITMYSQKK